MTRSLKPKPRSPCPIATSMAMLGDRWTLVLVRDMANGKKRFAEFLASPERITTSMLTDRLEQMERAGLITRRAYQKHPPRYDYALTPKGRALLPVLQALCRWANKYEPGTWTPPDSFMRAKWSS
ncbi:MAG: winged helix-turn-helix transcriptional regulator [Amphiplicatus sp.]